MNDPWRLRPDFLPGTKGWEQDRSPGLRGMMLNRGQQLWAGVGGWGGRRSVGGRGPRHIEGGDCSPVNLPKCRVLGLPYSHRPSGPRNVYL